jgi:hypothetical protein
MHVLHALGAVTFSLYSFVVLNTQNRFFACFGGYRIGMSLNVKDSLFIHICSVGGGHVRTGYRTI